MAIRPNATLATRNPVIREFMLPPYHSPCATRLIRIEGGLTAPPLLHPPGIRITYTAVRRNGPCVDLLMFPASRAEIARSCTTGPIAHSSALSLSIALSVPTVPVLRRTLRRGARILSISAGRTGRHAHEAQGQPRTTSARHAPAGL